MGGRGLVELESIYNAAVVGLSNYIKQDKDSLTRSAQEHDARKATYSLQEKKLSDKVKMYDTRNCCPKYQESA
jgi:hypothetical protein